MAEGLRLDHWKLEFSKFSFTISRGRCITWGVSVFFPIDASGTCYRSLWISPPGKFLRPEVFALTSPISNGDAIRADTAHRLIVKLQHVGVLVHDQDGPQLGPLALKLNGDAHFARRIHATHVPRTRGDATNRRRCAKSGEKRDCCWRKCEFATPLLVGYSVYLQCFLRHDRCTSESTI